MELKYQNGETFHVNFDNATKLLSFSDPNRPVGVVTYGQGIVGKTNRTAQSYLPEFEYGLPEQRLSVQEFAQKLSTFFLDQWNAAQPENYNGPPMVFVVAGYNEFEHFGRIYLFEIPGNPEPKEQNPGPDQFGMTWGGQREFVDRIIQGYDERVIEITSKLSSLNEEQKVLLKQQLQQISMQLPFQLLPLQDCVDLAIFLIRTTIDAQRLSVVLRGVGGPIEVATITRREGFRYIQRKDIVGEGDRYYELTNRTC